MNRFATLWAAVATLLGACVWREREAPASTGAACTPQEVPDDGFTAGEVYLESQHPDCPDTSCTVYHLDGDPTEVDPTSLDYVAPSTVDERVYCTCKCGGAPELVTCPSCPSGFECCPVFSIGLLEMHGSYCVRDGTCEDR